MHGFNFSWDQPYYTEFKDNDLSFYFKKKPKNMSEINSIANEAVFIEWELLKNSFPKPLPVKVYKDDEIKENIIQLCTRSIIMTNQTYFYNGKIQNPAEFLKEFTKEKLSDLSLSKLNEICEKKKVNNIIKEGALKEIKKYWQNVNIEDELLY